METKNNKKKKTSKENLKASTSRVETQRGAANVANVAAVAASAAAALRHLISNANFRKSTTTKSGHGVGNGTQ